MVPTASTSTVENEVGKAAKGDAPDVRFCDELEALR
jgi:hypothetical protein